MPTEIQIERERAIRAGKSSFTAGGKRYRTNTPGKSADDNPNRVGANWAMPKAASPAAPAAKPSTPAASSYAPTSTPKAAPKMREPVNPPRSKSSAIPKPASSATPKMREPANPSSRPSLKITPKSGNFENSRFAPVVKEYAPKVAGAVSAVTSAIKGALKADAKAIFKTRNGSSEPKKPKYTTGGMF